MQPLQPFDAQPTLEGLQVQADASAEGGLLRLRYRLLGPIEDLVIPSAVQQPRRLDELWRSTCLEAFLAGEGCRHYWELNLSPSGDWNLYRFDDYRQGGRQELGIDALRWSRRQQAGQLELEVELKLEPLVPAPEPLELSLTAVLEHPRRGCSYWALRHTGSEADFHRRDSVLPLAAIGSAGA